MTTKREVLDRAIEAVADRGLNYGAPEDNFVRIARLWNAHMHNRGIGTNVSLDATDVATMCALLKIARLQHQPDHMDSWVDLAGYAACGGEIAVKSNTPEVTDGGKEGSTPAPSVLPDAGASPVKLRRGGARKKVHAPNDGNAKVAVRNDPRPARGRWKRYLSK